MDTPKRCRELQPVLHLSIGEGSRAKRPEIDDEEVLQPFAVEVGAASAFANGFAVSALQGRAAETKAVVALIGVESSSSHLIEIGRVHGDVDPPALARAGNDLWLAVSDVGPSGAKLRLLVIRDASSQPKLVWGAEATQTRGESSAFDLELSNERGLLVWDELEKQPVREVVRIASFDPKNPATLTAPRSYAADSYDREMPELAARPSGFWLACIGTTPYPRKLGATNRLPGPGLAAKSMDAQNSHDEPNVEENALDTGNRWLELVPLDKNGSPLAAPIAITRRDRHVLAYDLASLADGSALLAFRDEETTPGGGGSVIQLARVHPNGSVDNFRVDEAELSGGSPSLLIDERNPNASWLALSGASDETELAALSGSGERLDELGSEPVIRDADVLAAAAGRLLIARPHGLSIELSVLACQPGPRRPSGAAEKSRPAAPP